MRRTRTVLTGLLLGAGAAGCAPPPPLPPPPAAPAAPTAPVVVWSARPDVPLMGDSTVARVPRPFSRLEVVGADSLGLQVVCRVCADTARGRLARGDAVVDPLPPDSVALGSLAEFALALRRAAERQDLATLRALMAPDFTFSLVGAQGRDEALAAWRSENFRSLARVPELLDRGLSPTPAQIWVAPPEHAERFGYPGLRLGLRQTPGGRWEWVFLIRAEGV